MQNVIMPKLSDTMSEGTLIAWHKAVGERVERGEVLAEVETDKATMELESFAAGVLQEIRVAAGTTVAVGTVIGVIGAPGEQPTAHPPEPLPAPPEPPAPAIPAVEPPATPQPPVAPPRGEPAVPGQPLAAPVVRRRAAELGIDLHDVQGSGPGGRILLEDLRTGQAPQTAAPPEKAAPRTAGAVPAGEPLSPLRRVIARTVSESWRSIPHFSVMVEARMEAAEQFRRQSRDGGLHCSLTALLVRAAAIALGDFPGLNASLQDERLLVHPLINIGVAVRKGDGLLVPVLHDCAALTLAETAGQLDRLVERARQGLLGPPELTGGTFAISNLGMYGVHSFVALIPPPMAAVLAVGAIREGLAVVAGAPAVARLMSLTLSADHRIADGAAAAEFVERIRQLLEHPEALADMPG